MSRWRTRRVSVYERIEKTKMKHCVGSNSNYWTDGVLLRAGTCSDPVGLAASRKKMKGTSEQREDEETKHTEPRWENGGRGRKCAGCSVTWFKSHALSTTWTRLCGMPPFSSELNCGRCAIGGFHSARYRRHHHSGIKLSPNSPILRQGDTTVISPRSSTHRLHQRDKRQGNGCGMSKVASVHYSDTAIITH